jgi:hypothetical protein
MVGFLMVGFLGLGFLRLGFLMLFELLRNLHLVLKEHYSSTG